jgi:hypothetical protein
MTLSITVIYIKMLDFCNRPIQEKKQVHLAGRLGDKSCELNALRFLYLAAAIVFSWLISYLPQRYMAI